MIKTIIETNIKSQLTGELTAPIVCLGLPGIGKSTIIRNLVKNLEYAIVDVSAATFTLEEASGIPEFTEIKNFNKYSSAEIDGPITGTQWSVPELILQANRLAEKTPTVILLDDLHAMPLATTTAMYELLLERKLKQYKLHDSVAIVCTANNSSEAGFEGFPSPIINRLQWLEIPFNVEDWYVNIASKFHPKVSSFIKNKLDKVQENESTISPYATPRTWEYLSTCLYNLPKGILEQDPLLIAKGFMSTKTAVEFAEHVEYLHKLNFESDIKTHNIFTVADRPFLDQVLYGNILSSIETPEDTIFMIKFLDHNYLCDNFIGFFASTLVTMYQRKNARLPITKGIQILINIIMDKPLNEFALTREQLNMFKKTPLTKRKEILRIFSNYLL